MKRHATDAVSLVFGLIFLGIAFWWGLHRIATVNLPVGWVIAVGLIAIGGIGLFAAVQVSRRSADRTGTAGDATGTLARPPVGGPAGTGSAGTAQAGTGGPGDTGDE